MKATHTKKFNEAANEDDHCPIEHSHSRVASRRLVGVLIASLLQRFSPFSFLLSSSHLLESPRLNDLIA